MDSEGDKAWGFWDLNGSFQNITKKELYEKMGMMVGGRRWRKCMSSFMCRRSFTISWDGKDSGVGKTNVGVPQGSLLSPVVFPI